MRWIKWLIVIVVILGAGVFFGVPALLETSWAKERVRTALSDHTGREVELGGIGFSWTSGLVVRDVVVKQLPGQLQTEGPLFELGSLSLKVGLRDILDQRLTVDKLEVEEPTIVLVRGPDGRFNIDDLIAQPSSPGSSEPAPGAGEPVPAGTPSPEAPKEAPEVTANLALDGGRILYIDQALGTRIEARDVSAKARWDSGRLQLSMNMKLNDGDVRLEANADLAKSPAPFAIEEFVIEGSEISAEMAPVGLFMPLMGDKPQSATGRLALDLRDLRGAGFDQAALQRSLSGSGSFELGAGTLASGPVIQILQVLSAIGAKDLGALTRGAEAQQLGFDLISSRFKIEGGKIITDEIAVDGGQIDLTLSGWTGLDGTLAYDIQLKGLEALTAANPGLQKILGSASAIPLKLSGTLANPTVAPDLENAALGAARGALEEALRKNVGDKIDEKVGGALQGLLGGQKKKEDGGGR